ncbi:RrF2 family transcriptional regulator [Aurantibacillus circumpalustris]|uniref:RrF2 family transcriptional regulator n=1 Tax=Aurantibacillus circumpalustris TaxID=3036359 RepID=UPI00295B4D71|nr:Rrf2 family transcriptional regulator [Aurantibacillus circumpalustris]
MFSKSCEYAIRATIYIAVQSNQDRRVGIKDISKEIDSPEAFTAKILQQLSRERIIDSVKGPNGGFAIDTERMSKIKLSQIVLAIDGDSVYKGCGLGFKECSEKQPCPVHDKFKVVRNELRKMLESTTVLELSLGLKKGLTFLHR